MRTSVELDKLGPLVEGREENPFAILGPHEVIEAGRRALSVRAFLPDSAKAWVVDPAHAGTRPMQRIHPAGVYEAICPINEDSRRDTYMLQHDRLARPADHDARSLCLRSAADRLRSASARRRAPLEELQPDRRAIANHRRHRGREFRRLGAECQRGQPDRRFQFLGWPPSSDAQAHSRRHLGTVRSRFEARARFTNTASSMADRKSRNRIPTVSPPNCRRGRPRRWPISTAIVGTTRPGWTTGRKRIRSTPRCRSTKCIWEVGAAQATIRAAGFRIAIWRINWSITAKRWATRISNCCPSASIPSREAGAIRPSAISPRPVAMARRRISCISSITAIRTASA